MFQKGSLYTAYTALYNVYREIYFSPLNTFTFVNFGRCDNVLHANVVKEIKHANVVKEA